jgi:hypothetical protein
VFIRGSLIENGLGCEVKTPHPNPLRGEGDKLALERRFEQKPRPSFCRPGLGARATSYFSGRTSGENPGSYSHRPVGAERVPEGRVRGG